MKKRILSILLLCCMVLTLLPTAAFAEGSTEELPVCTCETACMAESMNDDCSVCGAEGASAENCAKYADSVNGEGSGTGTSRQALTNVAITFPTPEAGKPVGDGSAVSANADSGLTLYLFGPALWKQGEEPDKLDENAAYAEGNTYLLNFTFYTQKPITDETVLTYNGKPITRYADYQALTEALDAYDGKQDAYLGCVLFSAEGTGDPAMEDLKDLYLLSLYAFVRVPEAQIPEDTVDEQFTLTSGGTYYFDLSGVSIPGTANESLPDKTMRYVPFTYAGTVDAYKLTSAMATTEEYAQQNKYSHSLFVADYAVTHKVNWNNLDTASLIFGKNYASGGVDYTLRAPSVGSNYTGSGNSERGVPQSNEWDTMLNKDSGYIQNWNEMYSWGQDTVSGDASRRAIRGYSSARTWLGNGATYSDPRVGFRPVLEVLNPDELGSDGLKAVTLDLGGGKLGGSSDAIHIIVKTGSEFTAPASDGLTRPDGDAGSFFMWLGSNGKFYAPGDSVPAEVTKLTAQWTAPTYAVTLNTNGGTINSGNVTSYTYGVGATLPTAGDMTYTGHTFVGWYDNENLTGSPVTAIGGTETGNKEYWAKWEANAYTVTLNTNGGTINSGNVTEYTYGVGATLPTAGDMTYTGHTFVGWYDNENLTGSPVTAISNTETGNKEYWAKWEANTYTVTLNTNGGTINSGNVTGYTYGVGATLPTADDMTYTGHTFVGWYDNENLTGDPVTAIGGTEMGNKEYWAKWEINQYTITVKPENGKADITITQDYGTPITAPADPTREGYTFAGWDKAIPATMPAENLTITAHWSLDTYSITYNLDGGTASGNPDFYTVESSTITLNPPTRTGYTFIGWSGTDLSGSDNLTVTIPAGSIGNRSYIAHWSLNTYSITYDLDGGTALGNPDFYTVESSAITLNEPTKAGYVFTGWSGTDLVGEDNLTVTIPAGSIGDRRYTAHWEFDPTIIAALNPTPNVDFLDVSRTDWFYYDVRYVCENGLMNGTSRNRFSPYGTATRGMLVTILYRMENEPRCFGSAAFSDVKPGAYYEKAVVWASQNNIVSGYTDGTFRPDAPVTREQLASILYRYTLYRGQDVSAGETTSLTGYGDAQAVSSYALPAMRWACGTGILQGANGKLNPSGLATRAQLAAMLHRYLTK